MPASAALQERFDREYRALYRDAFAYALRRCEDAEVAHDVAADALLVVWRRLSDAPEESWRPWVLGIARNVLANDRRAAQRRSILARAVADVTPDATDPIDAAVDRITLRAAWRALNAGDRDLLALVAWDGLDAGEAARVLGCSKPAFAVRLHRARRRLRAALAAEEGVHPVPIVSTQEA